MNRIPEALRGLDGLRVNPDWASLPLFDRTGWRRMPFGAFADSINERVEPSDAADEIYVGLDDLDSGSLHIRRWGKGSDVIGTKLRFRKRDIIFGRRRAYQRKLAVAEMDGICSAHAMVVRAKPDVVLADFLPFLMMSDRFMKRAVEISVGSLSPTINWTTMKVQEFDLPPLDQQRRIATLLWSTDDALQHNREILDRCTDALDAGFESHATADVIDSWPLRRLEQIVRRFIDYRGRTPAKTSQGVPLITARNVRVGRLSEEPREYIADDDYDTWMRRGIPLAGDVLFTTEAPMGNVARVPDYRFALAQRIVCLSPNAEQVVPAFFFWGMQSSAVQRRIREKAHGTTVMGIKQAQLRKVLFPVPDADTQRKIIEICDSLSHARDEVERHGASINALRDAMLNSVV